MHLKYLLLIERIAWVAKILIAHSLGVSENCRRAVLIEISNRRTIDVEASYNADGTTLHAKALYTRLTAESRNNSWYCHRSTCLNMHRLGPNKWRNGTKSDNTWELKIKILNCIRYTVCAFISLHCLKFQNHYVKNKIHLY